MKLPMRLALVLTLLAVTGGPVLASCEKSKRIDFRKVDCMEGGYKNKGSLFWRHWEAWARNLCSDKGKIVAKADVQTYKDKKLYLTGSGKKKSRGYGHMRGLYFCTDLSDLPSWLHPGWSQL